MAKIIKLAPAGPGEDAQRGIAEAKYILRNHDVRAVAFVFVKPDGVVGTLFAGNREGHFHQLRSGVEELRHRLDNVEH